MSWKVHAAIYAHAARLWLKGVPFHAHPDRRAAAVAARRS
jgi:DUF1365 family protein